MDNLSQSLVYVVIALAVLGLAIRRQMTERRLPNRRMFTMPLILLLVSLPSDRALLDDLRASTPVALFVIGLAVAAATGVARAATQRLTRRGGAVYARGTGWTLAMWLATVLVRVALAGVGAAVHAPESSGEVLLFLAVSLAVQNVMLLRRAGIPLAAIFEPAPLPETNPAAAGASSTPED